jgi:PAS domain S-box-containing protein
VNTVRFAVPDQVAGSAAAGPPANGAARPGWARASEQAVHERTRGPSDESGLLAEILDAMPERVSRYRFDDRVVVYCNQAWAAGHGATPEEVVGCALDDLLTPPEIEGMHAQLAKLSRLEPLLTDPNPRQAPEDPAIWIEWVDRLIPQAGGDEVLSIGRDVTARHEAQLLLERSEQRFRQAMVSAPVGMGIIAPDGHLKEVNQAFQRFIGRDEAALLGATWRGGGRRPHPRGGGGGGPTPPPPPAVASGVRNARQGVGCLRRIHIGLVRS